MPKPAQSAKSAQSAKPARPPRGPSDDLADAPTLTALRRALMRRGMSAREARLVTPR